MLLDATIVPARPPAGLLKRSREGWAAFRATRMARLVVDSDLPALGRLFRLYDERERIYRVVRRERVVTGSTGQIVVHPLYRQLTSIDSEIRQLEDRFGLTPMARVKLGTQFIDAADSLEEMNRRLEHDDDDEEAEDPRLAVVQLADPHSGRKASS